MWDAQRIVEPDWFLDRRTERTDLAALVERRANVLVYGLRRLGKSSLLRRVAADLPDHAFVFVNCQFAETGNKLAQSLLRETRATKLARTRQYLDRARQAAKGLEIAIEIKGESVTPVLRLGAPDARPLEDALEFIGRIAQAARTHLVIVLDEFQTIMAAEETVATLREHAQSQGAVSYVVAGSQPSVLLELTRRKNPFWRQLVEFQVGAIDIETALDDVARLTRAKVPVETRRLLQDITRGNTQRLAEMLETSWARHKAFSLRNMQETAGVVVARHAAGFERLVEQRTAYQREVMIALALDEPAHPTGKQFVTARGLRGPAFVQKAMQALQKGEILAEDGSFVDPLFAWWLKTSAGPAPSP